MLLSICIPTFNRVDCLDDCLNSIFISHKHQKNLDYEVCISDNFSTEDTSKVVQKYKDKLRIKFNKNKKNLGFALNALKTISMSSGDFVWMIGNDDLLLPKTLNKIENLISNNKEVEYFFINSYHLNSDYLLKFPKPFDTNMLPRNQMVSISKVKFNKQVDFWDVIDPNVSWDFLTGIYLSIFRRDKYLDNMNIINFEELKDNRFWSTSDNTLMHTKIICCAFKNSKSYICSEALSVNRVGDREWGDLYEFIEIVRIPEIIDFYRSQGMNLLKYLYVKNFSLRNFLNYMVKIIIGGNKKGLNYINIKKHILYNLIFPNIYISIFSSLFRFLKKIIKKIVR